MNFPVIALIFLTIRTVSLSAPLISKFESYYELSRSIEDTISVIQDVESTIHISDSDQVIFFIGNTKSGVSTITEVLSGDLSVLRTETDEVGNVQIKDDDDIIGSTLTSHTLRPKSAKTLSDVVFFDLPGINVFNGEKATFHETIPGIATSHVLQYVFSSVSYVKIVLVVEANLVNPHNQNTELMEYLLLTQKLIKNLDIYEQSMHMVVNKVETALSEVRYKEKIVKYFNSVVADLPDYLSSEERQFIENVTRVINHLEDGTYSKISPFNVPKTENVLLSSDYRTNRFKTDTNYALRKLDFANKKNVTVGYPVTKETEALMNDVIRYIGRNVSEVISSLPWYMKDYYERMIADTCDFKRLIAEAEQDYRELSDLRERIKNTITVGQFTEELIKIVREMGLLVPVELFNSLFRMDWIIREIEKMLDETVELSTQSWIKTLDDMKLESSKVKTWYEFILELYDDLSGFEVQTQSERFNVQNISDWGMPGTEQGLVINTDNFNLFLETVIPYFYGAKSKFEMLIDAEADDVKIIEVNSIIERTLQRQIEETQIKDTTILLKDSITICNALPFIQNSSSKVVSISALKSLIIDCDLKLNDTKHLSFYAPKWISNAAYHILLTGSNGVNYSTALPYEVGQAGLPGGNGGNFFGIGQISKDISLTVKSKGGEGGKGEDGGEGTPGVDRSDSPVPGSTCSFTMHSGSSYFGFTEANLYYDPNACGGEGKNGGVGGYAGLAGHVTMDWLTENGKGVDIIREKGSEGPAGKGGPGGKGGATDHFILENCKNDRDCIYHNYNVDLTDFFPPGKNGVDGGNRIGRHRPSPVAKNDVFYDSLNHYTTYLSQNLGDQFVHADLSQFIELMERNDIIKEILEIQNGSTNS